MKALVSVIVIFAMLTGIVSTQAGQKRDPDADIKFYMLRAKIGESIQEKYLSLPRQRPVVDFDSYEVKDEFWACVSEDELVFIVFEGLKAKGHKIYDFREAVKK